MATIKIGDRYRRPGEHGPSYCVKMLTIKHDLSHVVLVSENADKRTITIGASVILDTRQWVLV